MKTKVKLEGMQFYAFHGYYEMERKFGNHFVLNAEVELESVQKFDDEIEDTVNYEKIYQICTDEMKSSQKLLETVVYRILRQLKKINQIKSATIILSKKNPPMGGQIDYATVEMSF